MARIAPTRKTTRLALRPSTNGTAILASRSSAGNRRHHLAGRRSGHHRGSLSSGMLGQRGATPAADAGFHQRHRSAARDFPVVGQLPTNAEAKPQRGVLSLAEREALFQRFLEWRKNKSLDRP